MSKQLDKEILMEISGNRVSEKIKNDYKVREFKVNINFNTYGCLTKEELEDKLNDILRENIVGGIFPNSDSKSFTIKESK